MESDSGDVECPLFILQGRDASARGLTLHASAGCAGHSTDRGTGKKRGEAAEAAFLARATYLGFSVLHPWGESNRYDAVIDLGRTMLRVQVKSATSYHDGYTIKTTAANGHMYTRDEIDFVAGYVIPESIWYIMPVDAIGGRGTIKFRPYTRREVKPFYERYREAWCLLDCSLSERGWEDIPVQCRGREVGVQCQVCPQSK
jgi:hypothetical protein